jgi:branched-chain amino acid transport system ATP-binding protein
MLSVSNISVVYGAHRALEKASIQVDAGEIVVILGANGAGKSSLLKAISGTCEGKVQGKVELDGKSLSGLPAEIIVVKGVAFVPEGRGIFGDLTVKENLLLGAHAKEARNHQEKNLSRVYELFPKLQEREKQIARTMSGGEQQMVAIGRAIMANPKILMLDEPSLGLSPLLCKELFQNLSHVRDTGIGVLMVEQNAKQSLAISDRAYLLENGTITGENSAKAMMNDPAVQAAYLGGAKSTGAPEKQKVSLPSEAMRDAQAIAIPDIATMSSHKFIQPSASRNGSSIVGNVSGVDIASMVSKADAVSKIGNDGKPFSGGKKTPGATQARSSSMAMISKTPSLLSSNDPEVRDLLANFESAASSARTPKFDSSQRAHAKIQKEAESAGEILPEIPVYKRSKLEVYRRTPDGELVKVETR